MFCVIFTHTFNRRVHHCFSSLTCHMIVVVDMLKTYCMIVVRGLLEKKLAACVNIIPNVKSLWVVVLPSSLPSLLCSINSEPSLRPSQATVFDSPCEVKISDCCLALEMFSLLSWALYWTMSETCIRCSHCGFLSKAWLIFRYVTIWLESFLPKTAIFLFEFKSRDELPLMLNCSQLFLPPYLRWCSLYLVYQLQLLWLQF